MANTKKIAFRIFIAIAILVAVYLVWIFFFKGKGCNPNRVGYNNKGEISEKCLTKTEDPATVNEPAPSGSSGWVSDANFPIKKGSWGSKVKALQTALGVPADGKFGPQTESDLFAKTKKNEVSNQAEYNDIINPPAVGGGANFQQLKNNLGTLGRNFSGGVLYNVTGQNKNYTFDFYTNGRFVIHEQGKKNMLYKGSYYNGGDRMLIDGGTYYEDGGVFINTLNIIKELGN